MRFCTLMLGAPWVASLAAMAAPVVHGQQWVDGSSQPIQRITISSPAEDFVDKVLVQEGDPVKKGQELGELRLTRAQLEVKRLDGLVAKAQFDYDATASLNQQKIESEELLNEKKAELERLKVEREIAQHDLEERIIRSPIDGVVVFRLKDPGESIGKVEPLFEVIDSSKLKLTFFLPADYLPVLKLGMQADVEFPEVGGGPYKADLVFIDPQVDARSGLFRARFEFDNSQAHIPPGVRVRCRIPAPPSITQADR